MNEDEFFAAVCRRMGWPVTPWTISGLKSWARMESGEEGNGQTVLFNRCWNPLATTYVGEDAPRSAEDIGHGPGKWNNANPPNGVGMYASAQAGIIATANTIAIPWAYGSIRDTFQHQRVADRGGLIANFRTWIGSFAYAESLTAFIESNPASKQASTVPVPEAQRPMTPVEELNAGVMNRERLRRLASDEDHQKVGLAVETLRRAGLM